jgi:hypothetical protein
MCGFKRYEKEFVKWKNKSVTKTDEGKYYVSKTAAMKDLTIEELHNYWLTNIKRK